VEHVAGGGGELLEAQSFEQHLELVGQPLKGMRLGLGKLLVKCGWVEGSVGRAVSAQPRRSLADRGLQHEFQGMAVVVDDRHEQQVVWPAGRPVSNPKLGHLVEAQRELRVVLEGAADNGGVLPGVASRD
jgi:hypothetical protein